MFIGQYNNKMDAKGRLSIPIKFRDELGEKFIITRGLDSCLFGYSLQEWQKVESKIKSLPITKKNARTFQRFFFSGATEVEIDKQGRISNRIEIWDKAHWEDLLLESEASVEEIAEELEDFDF